MIALARQPTGSALALARARLRWQGVVIGGKVDQPVEPPAQPAPKQEAARP